MSLARKPVARKAVVLAVVHRAAGFGIARKIAARKAAEFAAARKSVAHKAAQVRHSVQAVRRSAHTAVPGAGSPVLSALSALSAAQPNPAHSVEGSHLVRAFPEKRVSAPAKSSVRFPAVPRSVRPVVSQGSPSAVYPSNGKNHFENLLWQSPPFFLLYHSTGFCVCRQYKIRAFRLGSLPKYRRFRCISRESVIRLR